MAPALKRKRAPVSYREPSSSDDDIEGTTEDDLEEYKTPLRRSLRSAPRERTREDRRILSYREVSSQSISEEDLPVEDVAQETRKRKALPRQIQTRAKRRQLENNRSSAQRQSSTAQRSNRRRKTRASKVSPKKPKVTQHERRIPSDGVKPDWSTLPYQILLQIFVYASHPVQASSAHWLLNISRMSRGFAEPALTALYRCPPITSLDRSHLGKLMESLLDPPQKRLYNYNNKVKCLELDVTSMPAYTPSHRGLFDLSELLRATPQVAEVDLFDPADIPPYRRNRDSVRWHYPDGLFTAMEAANIHLKSWRWNRLLFFKHQPILWMKDIHDTSPFKGLVNLALSNINESGINSEKNNEPSLVESLASALSVLSNLRGLTLESCSVVTGELLAILHLSLHRLNITNCAELSSDALQAFLISRGESIKELVLNHNQALDLSFLPVLKAACPELETLHMDLNYYNTFATHHDSDPKYEDLLTPDEVPTWPSSLRVLKMVYLRKWTSAAAETLFQSLIDSSEALPHLRILVLKAILDISWRDRAQFRDRWIGKLRRVFLRKLTMPSPHLVSMRAYREWTQQNSTRSGTDPHVTPGNFLNGRESVANPIVDSAEDVQTAMQNRAPQTPSADGDQSNGKSGDDWTGRRLRPRLRRASPSPSGAATRSDDSSSDEADESRGEIFDRIQHVQGLCTVVDVSIDNLRPREELFDEGDFLDDEASGDEDWNEDVDDVGMDEILYAW